jgi:RTX calcium-binding nonapeptide repeat (4 copies)
VFVAVAVSLTAAGLSGAAASTPSPDIPVPGPSASPAREALQPCTIQGDDGPNALTGTAGPDVICGGGGDDVIQGLDGDDVLEGEDGVDTATYESSPCCVRADLGVGTATGVGTDQLVGIENLVGTAGDDVLRGDPGPNVLTGLGGTDLLFGGDGDDLLLGGNDDDYLAGEGGAGARDGGPGADICVESGASCEPTDPPDGNDTRGRVDVRLVETGGSTGAWRVGWFGRLSKRRMWDAGYVVVSIDSREGQGFDFHVVVRSTRRRVMGLLLRDGKRQPVGRVQAGRIGRRGVKVSVGLDRLDLGADRAYLRWSVETIFNERRCRPCFDPVPNEPGAYPRPL